MAEHSACRSRSSEIVRVVMRLPIWLYRLGFGWLLGERFLLLNHVGRNSGRFWRTVLEVVAHDQRTDTYLIASGWGEHADWLRNIAHNPHVLVYAGARRF